MTEQELKDRLLALPREERREIVDLLIESLERDQQVHSAWVTEARRRYDAIRAGRMRVIGPDDRIAGHRPRPAQ